MNNRISRSRHPRGFTLLEVLLVIAIIAILAAIVIIALNPNKQLGDSRNASRRSDVNTILNAVYQYTIDNNGVLPVSITASATEVCKQGTAPATCTTDGLIDLQTYLVSTTEKYLVQIPQDPQCPSVCAANGAGYTIVRSANGRITVAAPDAEQSATITVTR